MSKDKTGNCTATTADGTCPSCGYCPHCGRRDAAPMRPYPFPYVAPWVYPRYPTGPIWINRPTSTPRPPTITFTDRLGATC